MKLNAKKTMSREQAAEIYKDLQKGMAKMLKNEAEYYKGKPPTASPVGSEQTLNALKSKLQTMQPRSRAHSAAGLNKGHITALAAVLTFAVAKVAASALEFAGFASVAPVEASMISAPVAHVPFSTPGNFSKEEMKVLTSLDSRRFELEEKSKRLEQQAEDLQKKDREFAARLTELRDLTDKLSSDREKGEKKRSAQLEQLANVYGSMGPQEAAQLIEQLDITIALPLVERMPEKRIGQILALMSPERALTITKMLSGRVR